MKVTMIRSTAQPVEAIYIGFKQCYAPGAATDIKVPKVETSMGDYRDNERMTEFIKTWVAKGHESPLEHVSFTFAIEGVSRALTHQLVRHRTFKFNQQSQRYVNAEKFDYVIPDSIAKEEGSKLLYESLIKKIMCGYETLVAYGIDKEDARYLLPNATTSNLVVTCDLRNFRHFYMERQCVHAQQEIRELAKEMMKQVKELVPFADYMSMKCGITCNECFEKVK